MTDYLRFSGSKADLSSGLSNDKAQVITFYNSYEKGVANLVLGLEIWRVVIIYLHACEIFIIIYVLILYIQL